MRRYIQTNEGETITLLDFDRAGLSAEPAPSSHACATLVKSQCGKALGGKLLAPKGFALPNIAVPLRDVGTAMTLHALQLVAIVMDEEASPEQRAAAREALQPFDEFRANAARRVAATDAADAAEAAIPDVNT